MVRGIHKLFVSNLPWTVGNIELKKYFQSFGRVVSANVVFDKKTGLSQKYGFVEVSNDTLANLEKNDRHKIEGNTIYFQSAA